MHERIKKLRQALDLTQQEFAKRIGSVQNTITGYETGRRVPSNQVIALICKEFHVNEEWLKTGEGDMFQTLSEDEEFDQICAEIQLSEDGFIKNIIRAYWKLPPDKKAVVRSLIDEIAKK